MIRMSTALRNARAQAIADQLDSGGAAGYFQLFTGGQPDPDKEISALSSHTPETAYSPGDYVIAGVHYYRAETAGTSASTAPVFPTDGSTVMDGDVVWQDMGEVPKLLGTLTLSYPCGAVLDGVLQFAPWQQDNAADASGIVAWGRFFTSTDEPVLDASIGGNGSGAAFIINATNVIKDGPLRITEGTTPYLAEGFA